MQPSEFVCTGVIIRDGGRIIIVTGELLALVPGENPRAGGDDNGQSSGATL